MDNRLFKRNIVNIQAELICADMRCASFIENLSEEGVYIVTAPTDTSLDFRPDAPAELRFELPEGNRHYLNCKIKWSYKTPPHGLTSSIGMKVIDPPASYREALQATN
jgi:hypothetical protein